MSLLPLDDIKKCRTCDVMGRGIERGRKIQIKIELICMPARESAWKRRWWNDEIYLLLPGEQTCNLSERLVSKPRHYNLRLCREQTGTEPKTRSGREAGG